MADSRPEIVKCWLATLAALVNAPGNPDRVAATVAIYIPLLLRAVPIEAFTGESVQAIARQCKDYMPSYGTLADRLEGWWDQHRPDRVPRLKAPEPAIYRVNIPERRPPAAEPEVAYVGELVATLVRDIREDAEAREAAAPPRAQALKTGRRMTDSELLAAYEQLGQAGAVRAVALRRKLGIEADRQPAEQDAWGEVLAARAADLAARAEAEAAEIPE
jgi:hypothetical protein